VRRNPRIFIYIEPALGYYARWVEREQERSYQGAGNVGTYWIELLRMQPESWDQLQGEEP
jgi:hypothetical protein